MEIIDFIIALIEIYIFVIWKKKIDERGFYNRRQKEILKYVELLLYPGYTRRQ